MSRLWQISNSQVLGGPDESRILVLADDVQQATAKVADAYRRFLLEQLENKLFLDDFDSDDPGLVDHIEAKIAAMEAEASEKLELVHDARHL